MTFKNYRHIDSIDFLDFLESCGIELDGYQRLEIRERFADKSLPFYVIKREKPSGKSPAWRLKVPLYFIVFLLAYFIILPLNFVFTGHFWMSADNKFAKAMSTWCENCGI